MVQTIHKKYLACVLFALSFLLFAQTIHYDAVWDDARLHFNPANQLKMEKDVSAFWKEHSGMYIPLTYSTWAVVKKSCSAQNFNPLPFHVLNIFTHSINAVLLFYLLLLLFKNKTSAFLGSLLFLIHPIQVESVAWISEFRGLYSTFFCLTSMLLFFKELEKNKNPLSLYTLKGYWLAFIFYVLALLAKPSGIVLPFIILVLCWRFYPGCLKQAVKSMFLWLLPAAVALFLLMIKNPESSISVAHRFVIAGYSLFFYIQKIMIPYPLVACYGYTPDVVITNSLSCIASIMCIVFFSLIFIKRKSFPNLFTAAMVIFICLLPVLGLVPFAYQSHSTVADRYAYMAIIGTALLMPGIEAYFLNKHVLKSTCISVFLLFTFLTVKQTMTWKNELILWDHALKFYDNSSTVYYNRGVQYSLRGNFTNAIADYSRALELSPDNLDVLFNRANAYENQNDINAAFNDYAAYLKINSKDGSVYYKRSHLFYRIGKLDEALNDLQRAEELGFPVGKSYKKMLMELRFKNPSSLSSLL